MILEGVPTMVQVLITALVALGMREVVVAGWKHVLSKKKTDAETDGIHLSNAKHDLEIRKQERIDFREQMDLVKQLREEMESDKKIIAALKDDKIEDDRKIARRDGIIDEQRKELRGLHDEMAVLRMKQNELERRVEHLERENKELLKENLQLKGMEQNASQNPDS
jgi:chromosome segregation ATPase